MTFEKYLTQNQKNMLRIKCSQLEQARNNPSLYAQQLLSKQNGGGMHGMFSYMQDAAKRVHLGENLSVAIKKLQNQYINKFEETRHNKAKQERLIKKLVMYIKQYDDMGFEFVDGRRLMRWDILSEVQLTGFTPWVTKSQDEYYTYYIVENMIDWDSELRFPLLQDYLVNVVHKLKIQTIRIGIYCIETDKFYFKKFSKREIELAIAEAKSLFQNVYEEYNKHK